MPRPSNYWTPPPGRPAMIGEGPAHSALSLRLNASRDEEGPRPTADDTRLRGSMALDCTRKVAFQILGVEPTIALQTDTLVAFAVGNSYHEVIQQALVDTYGARTEVVCSYKDQGGEWPHLSGHADAVYDTPEGRVCVEIKSMKTMAFDMAVGGNRYDNYGPGPKRDHVAQAGIYAISPQIDADFVHFIYVDKNTGRLAEWVIGVHEPLTHWGDDTLSTIYLMAKDELERLGSIDEVVMNGYMPERHIPGYGLVEVPSRPDSKEKPWNCRYCGFRDTCAQLPPGAFTLAEEGTWIQMSNGKTRTSST